MGFPAKLCIDSIKARIDTGARTLAPHAFKIKPFTRKRQGFVGFCVRPVLKCRYARILCEAKLIDERIIESPGAQDDNRHLVRNLLSHRSFQLVR
ncbi:MAG TPA: RimK/LysX family protein [Burkholderiales bacterium]|nr:RimK/LysX family protein [Burkholderiales bacterium]